MARKILFVARDGALIESPPEGAVDSPDKVRLMPGVIPSLLRLQGAGYETVVVTNQPGLGSATYRRPDFERTESFIRALFASQGISFAATLVCPHEPAEACQCRKPNVGLVREYLGPNVMDRERSVVIGASSVDAELAANIGIASHTVAKDGTPEQSWAGVARALLDSPRTARAHRRTRETDIEVEVDLDREADPVIATGLGFFDHMLEQVGKHGGFALRVTCRGDLEVDEHHTVEDVALTLGQALRQALGDKRGIGRYGFLLPMDETDAEVAIDLGGRPYLVFEGQFPRDRVGDLPTELVPHFFRSLAESLGAAVHVRVRGENAHHMVEACFKGVARTLRQALVRSGDALPSTKGQL
ncbi:MAG: bifunctional histidinol-phosphatase/imidazoleglycerol-phosphate dehydratase HisB [Gammaproteobacteria bacterium]|nr:bifunctional histidinol-phosphatase/imidazoleglycerol-phosphate dehydratase HisB [Gammaproteobacteria bacterium]